MAKAYKNAEKELEKKDAALTAQAAAREAQAAAVLKAAEVVLADSDARASVLAEKEAEVAARAARQKKGSESTPAQRATVLLLRRGKS